METLDKTITAPPKLIPSFIEGFNSVTAHMRLIILPVILDIFLWFAPRLNIKSLISPYIEQYVSLLSKSGTSDVQQVITANQQYWEEILSSFNLLDVLRTLPIGVPSLLSGRGVMSNPFGTPLEMQLSSFGSTLVLWALFALVGIGAGSVFFGEIARISLNMKENFSLGRALRMFKNTIYLTLSSYALIFILAIPSVIIVMLISMVFPSFVQMALIFVSLVLIWLLMPLIFSSHGIYGYNQNVFTSAINSIRLVRYFLPGTGIFILMGVLISQGMDIIWTTPTEDSWLVLIGILGHAFITTGLIASSFIYYKGGVQWMNEKMQRIATSKAQITLDKQ